MRGTEGDRGQRVRAAKSTFLLSNRQIEREGGDAPRQREGAREEPCRRGRADWRLAGGGEGLRAHAARQRKSRATKEGRGVPPRRGRKRSRRCAKIIHKGFYQAKNVEHKGQWQVDLVMETDNACEDLIFNHLRKHFSGDKFIGEESAALWATADLIDDPTWIVDPLDGTTNFVHGFPFVRVSIALTIGKIPTIGVVFNPIMNELFTVVRGKGAFLNGSPIKASSQDELVKALLVTEE